MHIQRVLLEGVGSLGNVDTDFQARGINLVLGPNESGKSTLCEAMVAIVYGFGRGESASRRAWNAAADDPYAGTLWIERDGTVYTLRRAFDSDQVLLTRRRADGSEETLVEGNANPRGRTEECRANCQAIREILCLPSEELLRASTHVGQLKAEVELDDELRQQISGAGQSDYRRAEAALEAQYYDLTVVPLPGDGRRRQPRLIEELEGRIEELCARKQAAERVVAQLREEQEQRDRHRQQYDDLEKQLNATTATERALTDYLERLEERERLDVEADRAQQYAERLNRYRRMVEDAEQQLTASELATLGSLRPEQRRSLERYVTSGAEQDLRKREAFEERLNRCTQRLADARLQPMARAPEDTGPLLEQLRRCREHVERLGGAVQAERPKGRPVGTAILFAVVLGIVGLLVAASAGLVLGLILGAALGWLVGTSRRDAAAAKDRGRLEAATEELAAVCARLAPLLEAAPDVSPEVLLERWHAWRALVAEAEEVRREMAAIDERQALAAWRDPELRPLLALGSQALEDRIQRYTDAVRALEQARERLAEAEAETPPDAPSNARRADVVVAIEALERDYPTFAPYRNDATAGLARLEALRKEIAEKSAALSVLQECIHASELRVAELRGACAEDPAQLAEQIAWARERLGRLVLKRDALALAIVTLREAVEQYQGEHLERLGAMMGEYFARFTLSCAHHDQQRYVGVHIGEDHRIEALHASGEMLLPDHLSVGARDQLYLALRLAVTDLIVQDMPLPLLLDDPFVNFDAQRREAALDVLAHIARDRQVILLSHDAVYARWAERVIDLANGRAAA